LRDRGEKAKLPGLGEPPVLVLVESAGLGEATEVEKAAFAHFLRPSGHERGSTLTQPHRTVDVGFIGSFAAQQTVEGSIEQRAGKVFRIRRRAQPLEDLGRGLGAPVADRRLHVRH
jgi:hypothetical protein